LKSKGLSKDDELFNRHMFMSKCGQYIYHVSIIDYMQLWNFDKKSEVFAKTWLLGKDKKQISAVEPHYYARRFMRFVRANIFKSFRSYDDDEE
jgi:hypothetical protein